jgi:RNA polymerase sigma-70 factor (ECF subfamily)
MDEDQRGRLMDVASQPDEWLMSQVRSGCRESLELLLRRYATPLFTFLLRMTGDRHHSEELFQEVFLTIWQHRRQYQEPRPFKPWLYAIAVNKCRAAFRGRSVTTLGSPEDNGARVPEAAEPTPEEKAMAAETTAVLTAAVARLPPQQRAVVVLRVWGDLSYAEIAAAVGKTEVTVRSHMHHALATLRKTLDPQEF